MAKWSLWHSQWIHKENGVHHWGSQVRDLQGAGRHDKILQLKKVSGPHIQTRGPGIPRCVRYQNDTSVSKVVTSQTGTLQNWVPSRTNSLPTQVAPRIETVALSVQHGQVVHCSRQSDTRKEAISFAATCHDLAKWLSHYLYFFSFLFLFFYLGLTTQKEVQESVTSQVTWQEVTASHHMMSHDRCGKIVHRPCSSCISSVENLARTLSSSLCQTLNKEAVGLILVIGL